MNIIDFTILGKVYVFGYSCRFKRIIGLQGSDNVAESWVPYFVHKILPFVVVLFQFVVCQRLLAVNRYTGFCNGSYFAKFADAHLYHHGRNPQHFIGCAATGNKFFIFNVCFFQQFVGSYEVVAVSSGNANLVHTADACYRIVRTVIVCNLCYIFSQLKHVAASPEIVCPCFCALCPCFMSVEPLTVLPERKTGTLIVNRLMRTFVDYKAV